MTLCTTSDELTSEIDRSFCTLVGYNLGNSTRYSYKYPIRSVTPDQSPGTVKLVVLVNVGKAYLPILVALVFTSINAKA